jgi:hypothetical protein
VVSTICAFSRTANLQKKRRRNDVLSCVMRKESWPQVSTVVVELSIGGVAVGDDWKKDTTTVAVIRSEQEGEI